MFKQVLLSISFIFLVSGCGGSGSSEKTTKEKEILITQKKSYDFMEYFFDSKVLKENEKIITHFKNISIKKDTNEKEEHNQVISTSKDKNPNKINVKFDMEADNTVYTIKEDKIIEDDNKVIFKRKIKIDDEVSREKVKHGEQDYVCIFSKHYDSVSLKDKVKEYINKDINIDIKYDDVIELSCKDDSEDNHILLAKNKGIVFRIGKERKDNQIEYDYGYIEDITSSSNASSNISHQNEGKTYDISEYFFNSSVLRDDKIYVEYFKSFDFKNDDIYNVEKFKQVDVEFRDDEVKNKILEYTDARSEDYNDDYKGLIKNTKDTSIYYIKDKIVSFKYFEDGKKYAENFWKRYVKEGEILIEDKVSMCTIIKHYDSLDINQKLKEYLNKDIHISDSMQDVYNDVLEMSCDDNDVDKGKTYSLLSKGIGQVLLVEKYIKKYKGKVTKYFTYGYIEKVEVYDK